MVKVQWVTRVTGNINASPAVFEAQVNTLNSGEMVYSQSIVLNESEVTQELSFKNKDGVEAFTIDYPAGNHNLFWKTSKLGVPQWAFVISESNINAMEVDSAGNVYVTASKDSSIILFNSDGEIGQTVELAEEITRQTILAKYNSEGILQWVVQLNSNDTVDIPKIKLDSDANIYVIGNYFSEVGVVDTDSTFTLPSSDFARHMFVIALSSDGVKLWFAHMNGDAQDSVRDVIIYEDHLYLTGVYNSDPLTLTPGTGSTKDFVGGGGSLVGYGILVALVLETGAYDWAVVFDSPNDLQMGGLQANASGIYLIGSVPAADVEIKDGEDEILATISHDSETNPGIFVCKISHLGAYLWHSRIDGGSVEVLSEEFSEYYRGSILDSNGNVFIKGHYYSLEEESTAPKVYNKDEELIGSITDTELGSLNVFILKLGPNGTFGWIAKIKPGLEREFFCWQMYVGQDNNLYLSGNTDQGNVRFFNAGGSSPTRTITTNTTNFFNPFVFSYSNSGQYRWCSHVQMPEFDLLSSNSFKKLSEPSTTRIERRNILINFFNNRLLVTPENRVYVNLVSFNEGSNNIFIENSNQRSLQFDGFHPYLVTLSPLSPSVDGGDEGAASWAIYLVIPAIIALIALILVINRKG